jgi:hypothetical protein
MGTPLNLVSAEKKVLLYSAPKKHFFTLRTPGDLNRAKDVAGFLASLGTKSAESEHLHFAFRS